MDRKTHFFKERLGRKKAINISNQRKDGELQSKRFGNINKEQPMKAETDTLRDSTK